MKPSFCQKCAEALDALQASPLTAVEHAEYDRLRAEEVARAERRREPSPQLQLEPGREQ